MGDMKVSSWITELYRSAFTPRTISAGDVLIFLLVILVISVIIALYLREKKKIRMKSLEQQYSLFKFSQMGLTQYEIGILNGMAHIHGAMPIIRFTKKAEYFENAIARFMNYTETVEDDPKTLEKISQEIVRIWRALYPHLSDVPTDRLPAELQSGILASVTLQNGESRIAKLISRTEKCYVFKNFGRSIPEVSKEKPVEAVIAFLGRGGTLFNFSTVIPYQESARGEFEAVIPEKFNVSIPEHVDMVTVSIEGYIESFSPDGSAKQIPCIILKTNTEECYLRTQEELSSGKSYSIIFEIDRFSVNSPIRIIAVKTLQPGKVFYYTVGLENISPAAKNIIQSMALKGRPV